MPHQKLCASCSLDDPLRVDDPPIEVSTESRPQHLSLEAKGRVGEGCFPESRVPSPESRVPSPESRSSIVTPQGVGGYNRRVCPPTEAAMTTPEIKYRRILLKLSGEALM